MHAMSVAAVGHATVSDAMTALALPTMFAMPAVLAMPVVLAMLVNMRCKRSICLYVLNAQRI